MTFLLPVSLVSPHRLPRAYILLQQPSHPFPRRITLHNTALSTVGKAIVRYPSYCGFVQVLRPLSSELLRQIHKGRNNHVATLNTF